LSKPHHANQLIARRLFSIVFHRRPACYLSIWLARVSSTLTGVASTWDAGRTGPLSNTKPLSSNQDLSLDKCCYFPLHSVSLEPPAISA